MAEEEKLDSVNVPPWLHLVSAFLAMEPPDFLLSLARTCGGGSITERVQSFIWDHLIHKGDGKYHAPYLRSFLKKLIVEVETTGAGVLDELYEQYASYMTSLKDDDLAKGNTSIMKWVSFLFPDDYLEAPTCPLSRKLAISLQCSLNMLEGDTGCSIWPSSLFLSEFILSYPAVFSSKSCFEVGSGVGLVGICLAHIKASKVILSDGDLSSLANMKLNLELNQQRSRTDSLERIAKDPNLVQCIYLPWESAPEDELQDYKPDIVLGADVIYDPLYLPHLIRVLAGLLYREKSYSRDQDDNCQCALQNGEVHDDCFIFHREREKTLLNDDLKRSDSSYDDGHEFDACQGKTVCAGTPNPKYLCHASKGGPMAYIASVIRNTDTFNYFLTLADQANLTVIDLTEKIKLFDLLPYMLSYQRSDVRLLSISYLCQ